MKKDDIKITTTMGEILDAGVWNVYCEKYGINEWCMNEGFADSKTEVQITLAEAERWGLIDEKD